MKFSEALAILEMEPSEDLDGGLVSAYRKAMKKFHPDVTKLDLDFALEMSKLVNEAYAFLAANVGKWSLHDKGETNVASWMVDVYNKIRHIPHIKIVRAGVWLWVTIEKPEEFNVVASDDCQTIAKKSQGFKKFKTDLGKILEEAGFIHSRSKNMYSWHCIDQGPRKRWKRSTWSWDRITQTFTTDELETAPRTTVA